MEWGMGFTHVRVGFLNVIGNSVPSDSSIEMSSSDFLSLVISSLTW